MSKARKVKSRQSKLLQKREGIVNQPTSSPKRIVEPPKQAWRKRRPKAPGDKECDESKGSKEKERETRPRVSLDPKLKNPERNDTVHVYGF